MSTPTLDPSGRWEIVSWEQAFDDGRRELPMGERLNGFIQYTADGGMACMIARAERPNFETGGQWNASDEEKARAYDQHARLRRAATRCDGDTITHQVDISLFPNWKGGEQKRRFEVQRRRHPDPERAPGRGHRRRPAPHAWCGAAPR